MGPCHILNGFCLPWLAHISHPQISDLHSTTLLRLQNPIATVLDLDYVICYMVSRNLILVMYRHTLI